MDPPSRRANKLETTGPNGESHDPLLFSSGAEPCENRTPSGRGGACPTKPSRSTPAKDTSTRLHFERSIRTVRFPLSSTPKDQARETRPPALVSLYRCIEPIQCVHPEDRLTAQLSKLLIDKSRMTAALPLRNGAVAITGRSDRSGQDVIKTCIETHQTALPEIAHKAVALRAPLVVAWRVAARSPVVELGPRARTERHTCSGRGVGSDGAPTSS